MKTLLTLLIVLMAGIGMTQELNSEQRRDLRAARLKLDSTERLLKNYADRDAAETERWYGREKAKFEENLKEAKEDLDKLPAAHPDVVVQLERFQTLSAQVQAVAQKAGAVSSQNASLASDWATYAASPQYKTDREFLQSLSEIIRVSNSLWDLKDFKLGSATNDAWRKRDLELAQSLPNMVKTLDSLIARYEAAGREAQRDLTFAKAQKGYFAAVVAAAEAFKAGAPTAINNQVANFNKVLAEATSRKDYLTFGPFGDVGAAKNTAAHNAQVYKIMVPGSAAQMDAVIGKLEATMKATLDKLSADIIKSNTPPTDSYSGADAAALKAQVQKWWSAQYAKDQIMLVRLHGQWTRNAGYRWDRFSEAWVKFDESYLNATVVIRFDGQHAATFPVRIGKNGLTGALYPELLARADRPGPNYLVLLSKFK